MDGPMDIGEKEFQIYDRPPVYNESNQRSRSKNHFGLRSTKIPRGTYWWWQAEFGAPFRLKLFLYGSKLFFLPQHIRYWVQYRLKNILEPNLHETTCTKNEREKCNW